MHLSLIQRAVIVALSGFVAWSTATTAQAQQIQTVFVISMENHNLTQPNPLSNPQQIKGNVAAPFLNSLMTVGNPNALQTSFATNYQNVAPGIHPSAPNYIWSQGGSNFGVLNDNDPFGSGGSAQTTSQNLSNYLQTAGITWKAYEEDTDINVTNNTVLPNNQWTVPLPSVSGTFASGTNAYNGSNQYNYDVNHDPMVYFIDTNGGNNTTPVTPLRIITRRCSNSRRTWPTAPWRGTTGSRQICTTLLTTLFPAVLLITERITQATRRRSRRAITSCRLSFPRSKPRRLTRTMASSLFGSTKQKAATQPPTPFLKSSSRPWPKVTHTATTRSTRILQTL